MRPEYLKWLHKAKVVSTLEGKIVTVFELLPECDEVCLNNWAKHFRAHYCADNEIDLLRAGYNKSREAYLNDIKFPDAHTPPGPSVRSGDFTEILIADYVQYVLDYVVPRTRYDRKVNRNSSTMGSDLVGYKCGNRISRNDELIIFEVKSLASEVPPPAKARLQKAIDDSDKDVLRLAETLNAVVQRLVDRQLFTEAGKVQRFQNSTDHPYKKIYAAAAVHSVTSYSEESLRAIITEAHTDPDLMLIVVRCEHLMQFIHDMYRRAATC